MKINKKNNSKYLKDGDYPNIVYKKKKEYEWDEWAEKDYATYFKKYIENDDDLNYPMTEKEIISESIIKSKKIIKPSYQKSKVAKVDIKEKPVSASKMVSEPEIAPEITPSAKAVDLSQQKSIELTPADLAKIGEVLSKALQDSKTIVQIASMSSSALTIWLAKKIGKPIVSAKKVDGKTQFVGRNVLKTTAEEQRDFANDFLI